jgi:hypothetical protein
MSATLSTQILATALSILENEKGWCRGSFGLDGHGVRLGLPLLHEAVFVCLQGALALACERVGEDWWHGKAINAIDRTLYNLLSESPSDWNDAKDRTKEDVLAVLRLLLRKEAE